MQTQSMSQFETKPNKTRNKSVDRGQTVESTTRWSSSIFILVIWQDIHVIPQGWLRNE
jgi:hypothetical protein